MCGIAGYIRPGRDLHPHELERIASQLGQSLAHRGPDDHGVWVDPLARCAFAHRRLSVIDPSEAGHQPMQSADGRHLLVFNGEIYNHRELRPELESRGHVFRSRTDTEVLLETLAEGGADALARFDGMYAFGLFDTKTGELLLGRDPFGEKPLYYVSTPRFFAFASELHALHALPDFDPTVEIGAIAEYLCLQYVDAPRTLYRNVSKLPPGHYLQLDAGGAVRVRRHFDFSPSETLRAAPRSLDDLADELEEILVRSIRRRLIADVPLGAFLSGGIDSSTIVALITQRLGVPIKTFSIGFEQSESSEHHAARRIADHLGADHRERVLGPDVAALVPELGRRLDEPNGDTSCLPTFLLSEFARGEVTVALSGDGGDEMFGGYRRYLHMLRQHESTRGAPPGAAGRAYYSSAILIFSEEELAELLGFVPRTLRLLLAELREDLNGSEGSLLARMRRSDINHYLPGAVLAKVDRTSMQHALEVRTPFLNLEVAHFAERLPPDALVADGVGKRILRRLAGRYLPKDVVEAPKQGFGLPMAPAWGERELLDRLRAAVAAPSSALRRCLGEESLRRFIASQAGGSGPRVYQISALLLLESYLRARPASLPDASRVPLAEIAACDSADLANAGILGEIRRRGRPVDVFCEREVPDWLHALPHGSRLVTPLPVDGDGVIEVIPWRPGKLDASARPAAGSGQCEVSAAAGRELVLFDRDASFPIESALFEFLERSKCTTLICRDRSQWRLYQVGAGATRTRDRLRALRPLGKQLLYLTLRIRSWLRRRREGLAGRIERRASGRRAVGAIALMPALGAWRATRGARARLERLLARRFVVPLDGGSGFRRNGGYSFQAPYTSQPLARDRDLCDSFILYEDGHPLPRPGAEKREVRRLGAGRYCIVNCHVYFAPPDNSDPNRNGRDYYLLPKRRQGFASSLQLLLRDLAVCDLPVRSTLGEGGDETRSRERLRARIREASPSARAPIETRDGSTRVALITTSLAAGGAERQVCSLACELARQGHDVSVLTVEPLAGAAAHHLPILRRASIAVRSAASEVSPGVGDALERPYDEVPELIRSLPPEIQPCVWRFFLEIQRTAPEFVCCFLDTANICGGLAAALAGVPRVLLSGRSVNPTGFRWHKHWYREYYLLLAECSRVLLSGNSRAGNEDYARWLGIDPGRFRLIRNGLDRELLSRAPDGRAETLRRALGIPGRAPVLLGAFRLAEEKQPGLFLEAVARLRERHPSLRALHVGEGPVQDEFRSQIEHLRLGETVRLLGRRSDVPDLMAAADVVLLTSRMEGTPNVLLEAQCVGTPVVTTLAGGSAEALVDGVSGYVCRRGSAEELAARCDALLSDPVLHQRMSHAGRRFVREHFSIERSAEAMLATLRAFGDVPQRSETPYPSSPPCRS